MITSTHRWTRLGPLLIALGAFWPVWLWYARRLGDGNGEVFGLVSMFTALFVLATRRSDGALGTRELVLPCALFVAYIAGYVVLPPIARAAIAFSVLAILASRYRGGRVFDVGIWGLFMLALPVIASFQFVFAYPLRVLVGQLAAPLIQLSGFMVAREGTLLLWGDRQVVIDAPCSGIHMLWAGAYLAFSAISLFDLDLRASIKMMAITFVVIVAANVLRVSSLFYLEMNVITAPPSAHDATGMASFMLGALLLMFAALRLRDGANVK